VLLGVQAYTTLWTAPLTLALRSVIANSLPKVAVLTFFGVSVASAVSGLRQRQMRTSEAKDRQAKRGGAAATDPIQRTTENCLKKYKKQADFKKHFLKVEFLEVYRTQISRAKSRYLILTEKDSKTGVLRAVVADVQAGTVQRVKSVPALLRLEHWQMPGKGDLTLDALVRQVPALRRHRGIEVRLVSGGTAWILWRQWSSADAGVQALLTETTKEISIPVYEPDGDYFLAVQAIGILGGEVLDAPRTVLVLGDEAY
jgi:hypothetical protein